ncbi:MAG: DUF2853 family protein [Hyphomicrobiaceae bacterium]
MSDDKEAKLAKYKEDAEAQLKQVGESNIDDAELSGLVNNLKLVIENRDAIYVAGTDASELETVRKNFIEKKCGVSDKDKGTAVAQKVADKMSGIQNKNRAAFYYLCKKELG